MTLDIRIRDAVEETVHASGDVESGLVALRRTRRRRTATRLVSCAVGIGLVLSGVLLRGHDARPEPAPPPGSVRNGLMLATTPDRFVDAVNGERPPGTPYRVDDIGPLVFSADGRQLFYAQDRILYSADLEKGKATPLAGCPDRMCVAAVTGDGNQVAFGRHERIEVHDLAGGTITDLPVHGWAAWAPVWSPDQRRIAFLAYQAHHQAWLSVLDATTGAVQRLAPLGLSHGEQPAWSPDGKTIAYIRHRVGQMLAPVALMTVPSSGGTPQRVHGLGSCCVQSYPAVTWSPDGRLLAVTQPPVGGAHRGGPVFVVHPDGTGWSQVLRIRYESRLAWQPVLTTQD